VVAHLPHDRFELGGAGVVDLVERPLDAVLEQPVWLRSWSSVTTSNGLETAIVTVSSIRAIGTMWWSVAISCGMIRTTSGSSMQSGRLMGVTRNRCASRPSRSFSSMIPFLMRTVLTGLFSFLAISTTWERSSSSTAPAFFRMRMTRLSKFLDISVPSWIR
jgi:hypothetical protein